MDMEEIEADVPDIFAAFRSLIAETWSSVGISHDALELARLRIAQLSGCEFDACMRFRTSTWSGVDEHRVAALSSWPSHDAFNDAERAILAYAEQLAIDSNGITDDTASALQDHLDETQYVRLTMALATLSEMQRVMWTLDVDPVDRIDFSPNVWAVRANQGVC